ncbi:MAG TPA: hypothetical protein VEF54_02740 [archaeon]|nr:hypothetical protein [archaeon]
MAPIRAASQQATDFRTVTFRQYRPKVRFAGKVRKEFNERCTLKLSRVLLPLLFCATMCGSAAAQFNGCPLNSPSGQVHHIIYIQFDNVHFERDNPNVPADLEQLPHLLNFLKDNGTLYANHHTPLISHTADDILTSLTGVYPDRHGQAVANSFVIFNVNFPATNKFFDSFPSSFTYWTDLVSATADPVPSMIDAQGTNAPAPWVPFTRFGCNVGAVSIANMEIENTTSDIIKVFGAGSPETTDKNKAADFEGISIHCALNDPLCSAANNGQPDLLPAEPNGYVGYFGLFGHKFVQPAIAPGGLKDLFGNPIPGFPGFGGISPAQTLAYIEAMLKNNVPIVFSYISDAHDCHAGIPGDPANCPAGTYGSGEAGYVAQLKAYDAAFAQFFQDLANMGIDKTNTLFIVSADEQDHEVAGPPSPANCDGVTTPCTYTYPNGPNAGQRSVGEVDGDLAALIAQQFPPLASVTFDYHFDMAPAIYLEGFGPAGGAVDPTLPRQMERATAALTGLDPVTGNVENLALYQVDHVGLKALHMITADPNRTPTYVMFGNTNFFFEPTNPPISQETGFAWNHGGVAPEINTTWVAFVGPGVKDKGVDRFTWTDEVDTRPTILFLSGLQDDYIDDGRVISEGLHRHVLPESLRDPFYEDLSTIYKQLNAPVGFFGQRTLSISTAALASGSSADDSKYNFLESRLASITTRRDAVSDQIRDVLNAAAFRGRRIDPLKAFELFAKAEEILFEIDFLAF